MVELEYGDVIVTIYCPLDFSLDILAIFTFLTPIFPFLGLLYDMLKTKSFFNDPCILAQAITSKRKN